jgi:hypothetical protein
VAPCLPPNVRGRVLGVFQTHQEREMGNGKPGTKGRRDRRLGRTALGAALVLLGWQPRPASAQSSAVTPEYRSKANFLATFPSFIDWPDDAFAKSESAFVMCVLGDFQFGTSLAERARSTVAHGRRVEVRWVRKDTELRACHVLFVSHSEGKLLQEVQGADVLTVGETPDFLSAGGAMSFSYQNESLQFEVNLQAAIDAHLRMSSRLLALARRVLNKPEPAKG